MAPSTLGRGSGQRVEAKGYQGGPSAEPAPRLAAPRSDWAWPLLLGLVVLGFCVALSGARGFDHDEAFTATLVGRDWRELWRVLVTVDANGAPYYLLLHAWPWHASGEVALRLPSAIFAGAAVPVMYALSRRLVAPKTANLATVLFAANFLFLFYGSQARMYALVVLLVVCSSYLFVRMLDDGGPGWLVLYVIAATAAVHAHVFAGFIVLAHFAASVAMRSPPWRRLVAAGVGVGGLLSPLVLFQAAHDHGQINWITRPTLHDVWRTGHQLTGARHGPPLTSLAGGATPANLAGYALLLISGLLICLALVAVVGYWRRGVGRDRDAWGLLFAMLLFVVPVAFSYAISFTLKPIVTPYYLIVSIPGMVLVLAIGLSSLRPGWRPIATAIVLGLVGLSVVRSTVAVTRSTEWREAEAFVAAHAVAGDQVLFTPGNLRRPFEYYLLREREQTRNLLKPFATLPDWGHYGILYTPPEPSDPCSSFTSHQRVWLIGDVPACISQGNGQRGRVVSAKTFNYLQVRLFQAADG